MLPSPERPSRELSECAGPRAPHRETSRALGEHATCPRERLSSSRNLENIQKIDRTLEMHHKSNFDPKNAIPIFMDLYCSVLPRKNTKPTEKTKLPLRNSFEYNLYLVVSGRFLWPKLMKFYQ